MRAVLTIRKEPHYRRDAFERGLRHVGFTLCELARPADSSDWLILWSRKRGTDEQRADAWEAAGGTVLVVENGYLAKVDKTHYAISVHGHNGSGWFPVGDEDRFSKLGFELKPMRKWEKGFEIVVRDQRGIGSTLMASPPQWGRRACARLRNTPVPVRLVPHPGDKNKAAIDEASLRKAAALLTWSSAVGVRALTEGIPVFYDAPHWICASGANRWNGVDLVGSFNPEAVKAALHCMSHGQWHFDEIATGEPFARIIANREKASWP